jgi:hypothetical protein
MATELDAFVTMLRNMGCEFGVTDSWEANEDHPFLPNVVMVSQAHFGFDEGGGFLGVLDDEMGNWHPRKVTL